VTTEKNETKIGKIINPILLTIYSIFALFPLFWMVLLSFKRNDQMFNTTFIFTPTWDNFKSVLSGGTYAKAFLDSLIIGFGSVLIAVVVGVLGAYALARYEFKGKESLAFTILSFKFAPEILVVLPLFMLYQRMGLYDTYIGLIWVYQLIVLPLIIWVLRGYFEDIPVEIEQASQLDGYNWFQIFFKRVMPLAGPGVVASALLGFIFAWNNFTFPLILTGFDISTVTVVSLNYLASDTVQYGQVAAAALISALPAIILTIFIQKHLVRGLSFGAIKQ